MENMMEEVNGHPFTVHLVGAQKSNYPWGFENRLIPALEAEGIRVFGTDFRQEKNNLRELLLQPADLVLVCKGEGIPPEWIQAIPSPKVLWWAELLGSPQSVDAMALERRRMLVYNISAFDLVLVHDEESVPVCRMLGARRSEFLPTAAVDPDVHRKCNVPKTVDVGFVGQITPRRKALFEALGRHVSVDIRNIWDPKELNRFFNETRIVLNIHLSGLKNTETRVCEVLGSGSFLLTESLSSPRLFTEGRHLVSFRPGDLQDLAAKIAHYLGHDGERERIAAEGHAFAHANHTLRHRVQDLVRLIRPLMTGSPVPSKVAEGDEVEIADGICEKR
jgi:spore maturation protein CgeB